jgi:DNA repair exonuclease SbcCD nuclease subunit
MKAPRAVIISDIHYSLSTLMLAESSMRQALAHATALNVPLIVAGDLHDTKGAMRGECVAAMLATFQTATTPVYIIPGNHCRINEKAKAHALEFLRPVAEVIDEPTLIDGLWFIPYESDADTLQAVLEGITPGSTLIMHTGVQTAYMGHYTVDRSSLPKASFAPFRVISGHYHMRQDVGTVSYVGNPYTMNFGEAKDPAKGFRVLNTDGSLDFVPTNLRKHIVLDRTLETLLDPVPEYVPGDLVKLRVSGPRSELEKLSRTQIGQTLFGHADFKFDLVPDKAEIIQKPDLAVSPHVVLDQLIDAMAETDDRKANLKALWRAFI